MDFLKFSSAELMILFGFGRCFETKQYFTFFCHDIIIRLCSLSFAYSNNRNYTRPTETGRTLAWVCSSAINTISDIPLGLSLKAEKTKEN